MKYSININQAGIADAGFADKTDIIDWAIVDYIFGWQNNPKATKIGALSWISYKHLIDEMPLLGLKTKQAVSARIAKLKLLGLISVEYDKDKRLYAGLSEAAHNASVFRADRQRNAGGVHENGQGVHENGQGGVHENGHTAVNQRSKETVNQEQIDTHQPKSAVDARAKGSRLPTDWTLSQELGDWALAEGLPRERIRQEADRFRDYWVAKPGAAGRKADWPATWRNWVRKAIENQTGVHNNGTHRQNSGPLSAVDRVNAAISARARERDQREAVQRGRRTFNADGTAVEAYDRDVRSPLD